MPDPISFEDALSRLPRRDRRSLKRQMQKRKRRNPVEATPEVKVNQPPSAGPIDVNDLIGAQRTALKAMEQFANAAVQLSQAQQQIAALQAQIVKMTTPADANPPVATEAPTPS